MSEGPVSQSVAELLDGLILALVVSGMGTCTEEAVEDLRRYVQSKEIAHTAADFNASLERAKRHFAEGEAHLFLCDGVPCRRRQRFEATPESFRGTEQMMGCPITMTDCQGPCKQAPVATLRVGAKCDMFTQFAQVSQ